VGPINTQTPLRVVAFEDMPANHFGPTVAPAIMEGRTDPASVDIAQADFGQRQTQPRKALVMEEADDNASPLGGIEAEIKELLGLFDVPAFARRGQDVEHSRIRLGWRCAKARDAMLDMFRLRLRQWAAASNGPDLARTVFDSPIDALWPLSNAPSPKWAARPDSPRRLRAIGRDIIASTERFNGRWTQYLDTIDLGPINRQIDHYNRYYVLEKECVLGSTRLAARHFVPREFVTLDDLRHEHPLLPVPQLRR